MTVEPVCTRSSGSDGIPSEFYKYALAPTLPWLSTLFNGIIYHGYVPTGLYEVIIRPIIKNNLGDPRASGNYRPIAFDTCASKLLEKNLFYKGLTAFSIQVITSLALKSLRADICIYALKKT